MRKFYVKLGEPFRDMIPVDTRIEDNGYEVGRTSNTFKNDGQFINNIMDDLKIFLGRKENEEVEIVKEFPNLKIVPGDFNGC